MRPMRIGLGTELGLQAASRDYSSSSRQTERAVQALQMGRASSIVPRGSGYATPPSRQSTWTVGVVPGTILTRRTEQRRIRPDRAIGRRSSPPSIGFSAMEMILPLLCS